MSPSKEISRPIIYAGTLISPPLLPCSLYPNGIMGAWSGHSGRRWLLCCEQVQRNDSFKGGDACARAHVSARTCANLRSFNLNPLPQFSLGRGDVSKFLTRPVSPPLCCSLLPSRLPPPTSLAPPPTPLSAHIWRTALAPLSSFTALRSFPPYRQSGNT